MDEKSKGGSAVKKKLRKLILTGLVLTMVLTTAIPVGAKDCSYELDATAVVCGCINIEKVIINLVVGKKTLYPGSYSAYVAGSNGAMAKGGTAQYSVGKGNDRGGIVERTPIPDEYCGVVMPTKSISNAGVSTVGIYLYKKSGNNVTLKASAIDTAK